MVSGGNRGLGLEMALVLCELGARAVYCVDLSETPSEEWKSTKEYARRLGNESRLEYISGDVRDQKGMWAKAKEIGDREGRMDVCIASAGVVKAPVDCLEYPAEEFQEVCHGISSTSRSVVWAINEHFRFWILTQAASCSLHKPRDNRWYALETVEV